MEKLESTVLTTGRAVTTMSMISAQETSCYNHEPHFATDLEYAVPASGQAVPKAVPASGQAVPKAFISASLDEGDTVESVSKMVLKGN